MFFIFAFFLVTRNKLRLMRNAHCDKICRVRIVRKMNYEKVLLERSNGRPLKKSRPVQNLVPPIVPRTRMNVPNLNLAQVRSILRAPALPASVFGVGRSLMNRRVTFSGIDRSSVDDEQEMGSSREHSSNELEIDRSSQNHEESEVNQRNRDQPLIDFS